MATPDLSLLNDTYRLQYDQLIQLQMDPQAAFDSVYAEQQSEEAAKQQLVFEGEQQKLFDAKQYDKLDPQVQEALKLLTPNQDYTKPFVQRYMPGFVPEVVKADDLRSLPASSITQAEKVLTAPTLDKLKSDAYEQVIDYYQKQGYPTYEQTQKDNVERFVKEYGTKNEYVASQVAQDVPQLQAEYTYDMMLNYMINPPLRVAGTAEDVAYQSLYGPGGPYSFGPLDNPIQPRRYSESGTMEPVGPRAGFMQGASPLAEEIRKDPEIVRGMTKSQLFEEATRPQVVKSGEQVRLEKEEGKSQAMNIEGGIRLLLKDNPELTEASAYPLLIKSMEEQAYGQIEKQRPVFEAQAQMMAAPGPFGGEMMMFEQSRGEDYATTIAEEQMHMAAKKAVYEKFKQAGLTDKLQYGEGYEGMALWKVPVKMSEAMEYIFTDPDGNDAITELKKSGRIDPDSIVESTPAQYARNLNLVFRAVINPGAELLENVWAPASTWIGEVVTGEEQETPTPRVGQAEIEFMKKYSDMPANPTYDFTEEVEYQGNPIEYVSNITDAYVREILLETATGRTLGNDIVSLQPEIFYMRGQEEMGEQAQRDSWVYNPDVYVIGGTLGEVIVPIEVPVALAGKAIAAGTKVPANLRTYGTLAREMERTGDVLESAARTPGTSGSTRTWTEATKDMLAQDSKVSSKVADDAADVVIALERVQEAGATSKKVDPIVARTVLAGDLSPKGQRVVDGLLSKANPAEEATKILTGLENDVTRPVLSNTVQASKKTGEVAKSNVQAQLNAAARGGGYGVPNPTTTLERRIALRSAAMETLEGKYGLGEWYMVTPRMAISQAAKDSGVVDDALDNVVQKMGPMQPGLEPRVLNPDFVRSPRDPRGAGQMMGQLGEDVWTGMDINYRNVLRIRERTDPRLKGILDKVQRGEAIPFEDDFYLRQILLETEISMIGKVDDTTKMKLYGIRPSSEAIRVTPESTFATKTAVPSTRRSGLGRTIQRGIASVVPPARVIPKANEVRAGVQNAMRGVKDFVWGTTQNPIQKAASDTTIALQRQAPLAMGRLAQTGGNPVDDAFAMGFTGKDYTEVVGIQDASKIRTMADDAIAEQRAWLAASQDLANEERVKEFYKALLGEAFEKPDIQIAYQKATARVLDGLPQERFMDDDIIRLVLTEMQKESPEALRTAAITGRPKVNITPNQVDIQGTKIASAISASKASRLDDVAKNMGSIMGDSVTIANPTKWEVYGISPEKARELINVQAGRLLNGTTRSNVAELEAVYAKIMGKPYDPAMYNGKGIVAFMSNEFGQEAQSMRNYILYHKENLVARGYAPEVAIKMVQERGIPVLMEGQTAQTLEKLAPEAFGGLRTATTRAGVNETIASNIVPLRRASPNMYRYFTDLFDYAIAPRRRLVADTTGGLGLPNPLYHTTQYLSAPIIASVTDPSYIGTIINQQARGLGMAPLASGAKGTFRVNPSVAKDVELGAEGLSRFVTGDRGGTKYIGNYTVDEAIYGFRTQNLGQTTTSLQFSEDLVQNARQQAQSLAGSGALDKGASKFMAETIAPGLQASMGMELADSTNRMFREAIYFEALSRGHTIDEAARLAREVMLDFSSMPGAAREGLGAWLLLNAFTYALVAETALALTKPTNMKMVTAQLNMHRQISEAMYGKQTELKNDIFFNEINSVYDPNEKVYEVYFKNPVVTSFSQAANIVENFRKDMIPKSVLEEAAKGVQTMDKSAPGMTWGQIPLGALKATKNLSLGIAESSIDMVYAPVRQAFDELSEDNNAPPASTIYYMSELPNDGLMSGAEMFKYFDMEYVPMTERVPGRPEVGVDRFAIVDPITGQITYQNDPLTIEELQKQGRGGYQIKFHSNEGRQKFIAYNQFLKYSGYQRAMDDLVNVLIMSGQLPEGTTWGYTEKGNPALYLLGGQHIVRLPPEWEKQDRIMKMYEAEYKKKLGTFK